MTSGPVDFFIIRRIHRRNLGIVFKFLYNTFPPVTENLPSFRTTKISTLILSFIFLYFYLESSILFFLVRTTHIHIDDFLVFSSGGVISCISSKYKVLTTFCTGFQRTDIFETEDSLQSYVFCVHLFSKT